MLNLKSTCYQRCLKLLTRINGCCTSSFFNGSLEADYRQTKILMSAKTANGSRSPPSIFISYSHADESRKDRVVKQLRVLEPEENFRVWDDRRIDAGDDWYPGIEKALTRASVAILLISDDFLTSQFILGQEVPRLLRRRKEEGLRVIPLIVWPCAWQQVSWLKDIQSRPLDGLL
jgi:hypothetical protein